MLRALIWDVDGTLAETERDGHRIAFNQAFAACGLPWRWGIARYGRLLRVSGGRERLLRDMAARADAPARAAARERLARRLHGLKNELYAARVAAGGVRLRRGVRALMGDCRRAGLPMAIVTTTSRSNVEALLGRHLGHDWTGWFGAIVCGEDVRRKKPDPEAHLRALRVLGLPAPQAIAIEDAPAGVAAARAAGCPVIVTRSRYFARTGRRGALAAGPGLGAIDGWLPAPARKRPARPRRVTLGDLAGWLERQAVARTQAPGPGRTARPR